jgi:hypothetical protein
MRNVSRNPCRTLGNSTEPEGRERKKVESDSMAAIFSRLGSWDYCVKEAPWLMNIR